MRNKKLKKMDNDLHEIIQKELDNSPMLRNLFILERLKGFEAFLKKLTDEEWNSMTNRQKLEMRENALKRGIYRIPEPNEEDLKKKKQLKKTIKEEYLKTKIKQNLEM